MVKMRMRTQLNSFPIKIYENRRLTHRNILRAWKQILFNFFRPNPKTLYLTQTNTLRWHKFTQISGEWYSCPLKNAVEKSPCIWSCN